MTMPKKLQSLARLRIQRLSKLNVNQRHPHGPHRHHHHTSNQSDDCAHEVYEDCKAWNQETVVEMKVEDAENEGTGAEEKAMKTMTKRRWSTSRAMFLMMNETL